jgi:hypothetical protein
MMGGSSQRLVSDLALLLLRQALANKHHATLVNEGGGHVQPMHEDGL